MTEGLDSMTMAGVVVGGVIVVDVIREVARVAVRKVFPDKPGFVTVEECRRCKEDQKEDKHWLKSQLAEIKGVLLVVAVKAGADKKDIQGLVK